MTSGCNTSAHCLFHIQQQTCQRQWMVLQDLEHCECIRALSIFFAFREFPQRHIINTNYFQLLFPSLKSKILSTSSSSNCYMLRKVKHMCQQLPKQKTSIFSCSQLTHVKLTSVKSTVYTKLADTGKLSNHEPA